MQRREAPRPSSRTQRAAPAARASALAVFLAFASAAPHAEEAAARGQETEPEAGSKQQQVEERPKAAASAVSLEEVLRIARERSPAIAAARARVKQAEGRRFVATVPPDPAISAGAGRGEPRDGGGSGAESSFEISQFLPAPWGLRARGRSASAAIQAAADEVEAITLDVVFEAKRLYYAAAIVEAQSDALTEAAGDAASLRDLVARRVEVGEAPAADLLRTRVEALRTGFEARAARAEAEGARAALDRFLLGALGFAFSLSTDLDPHRLPRVPEDVVEAAVARSPARRAALSRAEAARWSLSAERASRVPGIEASVFQETEFDREGSGATLRLSVPLWNRNRGAIGISRGELEQAEADALDVRIRIEAEVERLARRDRLARELAIAYGEEILPAAREALAIARASLEQGEATLLAWLEARRSYLETLRASYQARYESFLTRAELERLAGDVDAPVHD